MDRLKMNSAVKVKTQSVSSKGKVKNKTSN